MHVLQRTQNTLWPEAYKLYGHGDMIYCCAASPDGAYLASACVAKSEQQAAVWIWDIQGGNWKAAAQLKVPCAAHRPTVAFAVSACTTYARCVDTQFMHDTMHLESGSILSVLRSSPQSIVCLCLVRSRRLTP